MATRLIGSSVRALCAAAALSSACVADASITIYNAVLTGASESPANASPGTGNATVTIDTTANTMQVDVTFAGLLGTTTASHIHAPTTLPLTGTAGVATQTPSFTSFPLGVTSGTYSHPFDLLAPATYNSAYVTANGGTAAGAEAALLAALASNQAYLNIHTSKFGGGEIRGFLTAVPEPATWMMMMLGFAAIGVSLRRRRNSGPQIDLGRA